MEGKMTDSKNIIKIYSIFSTSFDAEGEICESSEGIAFTTREDADKYIANQISPMYYGIHEIKLYSQFDEDVF